MPLFFQAQTDGREKIIKSNVWTAVYEGGEGVHLKAVRQESALG